MGFLKRLTSRSKSHQGAEALIEITQWNTLHSITELDRVELQSNEKPQVLFKHSSRCGISSMVLRRFKRQSHEVINGFDFYMLDVISDRALSNAIAERYGIIHESPQLIVLKGGAAVFNDSHHGINTCKLGSFL